MPNLTEREAAALDDIATVIWRETYRHDTLLNWPEIKRGTMHWKRVMAAARAALNIRLRSRATQEPL